MRKSIATALGLMVPLFVTIIVFTAKMVGSLEAARLVAG